MTSDLQGIHKMLRQGDGADVGDNSSGFKEIFQAVAEGKSERVMSMIDSDSAQLNVADHNQSNPLTRAFAYEHIDLALSLVRRGANAFAMNHSDRWGLRYVVEKVV